MQQDLALRRYAAYCVGKAQAAQSDGDKAVWVTMAQAWLRLAQTAAQVRESDWAAAPAAGEVSPAARSTLCRDIPDRMTNEG